MVVSLYGSDMFLLCSSIVVVLVVVILKGDVIRENQTVANVEIKRVKKLVKPFQQLNMETVASVNIDFERVKKLVKPMFQQLHMETVANVNIERVKKLVKPIFQQQNMETVAEPVQETLQTGLKTLQTGLKAYRRLFKLRAEEVNNKKFVEQLLEEKPMPYVNPWDTLLASKGGTKLTTDDILSFFGFNPLEGTSLAISNLKPGQVWVGPKVGYV